MIVLNKIKIYVAGTFEDKMIVKKVIKMLSDDYIITRDWTDDDGNKYEAPHYCELDRNGVINCNVLVLINSKKISSGKMWECGIADGLNIPIIVVGSPVTCVFRFRVKTTISTELDDISEDIIKNIKISIENVMKNKPFKFIDQTMN